MEHAAISFSDRTCRAWKPVSCSLCNEAANSPADLQEHILRRHPDPIPDRRRAKRQPDSQDPAKAGFVTTRFRYNVCPSCSTSKKAKASSG
jgi:hypothetical protein